MLDVGNVSGCGEVLVGQTGTFTSPNYPADYDNNLNCQWTISVPSGNIQIDITSLDVEDSSTCSYDKLEVSLLFNKYNTYLCLLDAFKVITGYGKFLFCNIGG